VLFGNSNYNDEIKENEVDRNCSTNDGREKCIWDVGGKALKKDTSNNAKMWIKYKGS
jgi:hypothetical protein